MCYEASQLAEKIYREAIRIGASDKDIKRLKLKWESLKEVHKNHYHSNAFSHEKFALFTFKEKLDLRHCYWGLIPSWTKSEKQALEISNKTINARGETLFEKPSFLKAATESRCIIPLDGFYEYHHKNGKTYPYFIHAKSKKRLMLGGVMETWLNKSSGELIDTFSIVTTRGNDVLAKIHNNPKLKEARMPLLLEDKDIKYWLNNSIKEVQKLIVPNITSALDYHTVQRLKGSKYLGNIPEVQRAYTYNELLEPPSLFS